MPFVESMTEHFVESMTTPFDSPLDTLAPHRVSNFVGGGIGVPSAPFAPLGGLPFPAPTPDSTCGSEAVPPRIPAVVLGGSAAGACSSLSTSPSFRLHIVSKVGCIWCERLKEELAEAGEGVAVVEQEQVLDPKLDDYVARRDEVLERAGWKQNTFPFVFDASTGALIGGYTETMQAVRLSLDMDADEEW